jgi:mono/diheme cytochrome c family protein
MFRIVAALCGFIFTILSTQIVAAADVRQGETIAKRWCASCHVVAADQKRGTTQAPPFSAIAKKPGFDENKIATFLQAGHPKMPDMNLSRAETANLAAYIKSQR